jgi:protein farnesyltransferase subunit beta
MTVVDTAQRQPGQSFMLLTESTRMQQRTEMECLPFFANLAMLPDSQLDHLRDTGLLTKTDDTLFVCLLTGKHIEYLEQVWKYKDLPQLRPSFVSLDSSRAWVLYWSLHACDLLGYEITDENAHAIVQTLKHFFTAVTVRLSKAKVKNDPILSAYPMMQEHDKDDDSIGFQAGGFGGGPGQISHAATTYAAVLSLCILARNEVSAALALLDKVRVPLYAWMISLHDDKTGSFRMHHDGEIDVRATYCVISVASLLNLLTPTLTTEQTTRFVGSCQTWEGGFGGEPHAEAHGGYTFCAIAALELLGRADAVDLDALAGYLSRRQMQLEGGFSGRSNKLVDGCYSFWQGGAMAIASAQLQRKRACSVNAPLSIGTSPSLLFDKCMLERYILLCAQDVHGGLRDKPSKNRDHYHSCYTLSGLSVAQHYDAESSFGHPVLSKVGRTHVCYNIRVEHAQFCLDHFAKK